MLTWYPPEMTMPLLAVAGLAVLRLSRGRSIWLRNLGGFLLWILILHLLFIPNIGLRLRSGYTSNVAETGASAQLPELLPRPLPATPDQAFAAAVQAAERLKHFDIVASDPAALRLTLTVGVPAWGWWPRWPLFSDDMTVQVVMVRGGSQLHIRSASRGGRPDLGENRRHIAQFLQAVEGTIDDRR